MHSFGSSYADTNKNYCVIYLAAYMKHNAVYMVVTVGGQFVIIGVTEYDTDLNVVLKQHKICV